MKKSIKKFLVVLLVLCPILVGCSSGDDEKDKKTETKKVEETSGIKTVTKEDWEYRNSAIEVDENGSTVITEVINKDEVAREITTITLELNDKDGNLVEILTSYIGKEVKPNESVATVAKTSIDLSNVVSIDYSAQ